MCGIIGEISSKDVKENLLNGLEKLEYRGYDSAGIALLNHNDFYVKKEVGSVRNLKEQCDYFDSCFVGIAHTRWATHGKVTKENSHPHLSDHFALVHNGIIENYKEVKSFLEKNNFSFKSNTDSEVIVLLLEYFFKKHDNINIALLETIKLLNGSFSFAFINKKKPDLLWVVKHSSPLIIGKTDSGFAIASDRCGINHLSNSFCYLDDKEIAQISPNDIIFFNFDGQVIEKEFIENKDSANLYDKGKFDYFMEKEIFEQPIVIKDTIKDKIKSDDIFFKNIDIELFKQVKNIEIVSCGTSYHASLIAKYLFEEYLSIPCEVTIASEYRYKNSIKKEDCLFITISQSGETADTLSALEKVKRENKHISTLTICNVENSTIDRISDYSILTQAGTEIGVASTKAFTTQLTVLLMLLFKIGKEQNILSEHVRFDLLNSIQELPYYVSHFLSLKNEIENVAKYFKNVKNCFYIGRQEFGALAMEGALKIKEISYIHAEAFFAGELKHGSISLIEKTTPTIAIGAKNTLFPKLFSNVEEVLSRDGFVLLISDDFIEQENLYCLQVPTVSSFIAPICYTIILQLFAFYVAKEKGREIDKPRNLAKSVTVE